jgi:hypothetical protein
VGVWEAAGVPPPLLKKETEQTHYNILLRTGNVTIRLPFEDEEILKKG